MSATVFYDNVLYDKSMTRWIEDGASELLCARCRQVKPVSEFPITTARGKKQYWSYCKDCRNEDARDRRKAMPEKYHARENAYYRANRQRILENGRRYRTPERNKNGSLKKLYGITLEEYNQLTDLQSGACAICGKAPRGVRPLHVDHNHETGQIRGLLCTTCNVGLGALQDSVALLRAALAYLEKGGGA